MIYKVIVLNISLIDWKKVKRQMVWAEIILI